jgi:hypothetical protein
MGTRALERFGPSTVMLITSDPTCSRMPLAFTVPRCPVTHTGGRSIAWQARRASLPRSRPRGSVSAASAPGFGVASSRCCSRRPTTATRDHDPARSLAVSRRRLARPANLAFLVVVSSPSRAGRYVDSEVKVPARRLACHEANGSENCPQHAPTPIVRLECVAGAAGCHLWRRWENRDA